MPHSFPFIKLIMYSSTDLSIYKYNIYKDLLISNTHIHLCIALILKWPQKKILDVLFSVYALL